MKFLKRFIVVLLVLIVMISLIGGGFYLKFIREYKQKVEALSFADIDLRQVTDGTYEGSCDTGVVNATAVVTVQDHTITNISLTRHDNGKGAPAEAILGQMLREQSTDVDIVSGATCSSRVIRKAVENALEKGVGQAVPEAPAAAQEPTEPAATEVPVSGEAPAQELLTVDELVGPWHLAEETEAIFDAFPGSMEFGSTMEIRSNGAIAWYIGADGGTGTYTIDGNVLHCELTNSMDGSAMTMDFTAEKENGQRFLTTVYRELELRWRWGEGETGRGE